LAITISPLLEELSSLKEFCIILFVIGFSHIKFLNQLLRNLRESFVISYGEIICMLGIGKLSAGPQNEGGLGIRRLKDINTPSAIRLV